MMKMRGVKGLQINTSRKKPKVAMVEIATKSRRLALLYEL